MAEFKKDWFVIGISGVTCGGKTTLANKLKKFLSPVYVFHQDKYFYPDDSPKHVKCEGLAEPHNNYDILSALDMESMYQDVLSTLRGEANRAHFFCVTSQSLSMPNKKFLIVEGFTVINYKPIRDLCDLSYYLVLEYGECAARRCRRLYEPPDVAGYLDTCAWPEHVRYRAQIEKEPNIHILDGTRHDAFEIVVSKLRSLGAVDTQNNK